MDTNLKEKGVKKSDTWKIIAWLSPLVLLASWWVAKIEFHTVYGGSIPADLWIKVLTLFLPALPIIWLVAFLMPTLPWGLTEKGFILLGFSFLFLFFWSTLLHLTGWVWYQYSLVAALLVSLFMSPIGVGADALLYFSGREILGKRRKIGTIFGVGGVLLGTVLWMLLAKVAIGLVDWLNEM